MSQLNEIPSDNEIELARESNRTLSAILRSGSDIQQIDIYNAKGEVNHVRLPVAALHLLSEILAEIGQGNAVSIIPIHTELTTQESADVLNVSRPYFVKLLETGQIPFRKVGTHRKVRYLDVLAYKSKIDNDRNKALDELSAQAQELDMGY